LAYKRPPKNYFRKDHPLPHSFDYTFSLTAENETKNSTLCTLIMVDNSQESTSTIEVNPTNANFAEEPGTVNCHDSIIPKMMVKFSASLTKGAIETDKLRAIRFNWVPLYFAFPETYEAADTKTDVEVEDVFEMAHSLTKYRGVPLFAGTKLLNGGNHPLSTKTMTQTLSELGLTTTAVMEHVAYDEELLWKVLQYYTNAGMVRRVMGKWRSVTVTRDRPYNFYSNNFTHPTVKRANDFTHCVILFHLPQAGSVNQYFRAADTTDIAHLDINLKCRYDEWNPDFDQSSI